MSAHAPGSEDSQRLLKPDIQFDHLDEPAWLEFSGPTLSSPANVWDPDDEDDEITIQTKRPGREQESAADSPQPKTSRPVRVLDEWAVLPGEASYATVKLNHEIELPDWDDSEDPEEQEQRIERPSPESKDSVRANSQVRRLAESQVLPGEVSFATVMLNSPHAKHSYSPFTEFHARTNVNLKPFLLAAAILVAGLGLVTWLILLPKTEGGADSSPIASRTATGSGAHAPGYPTQESVDTGKSENAFASTDEKPRTVSVKDAKAEGRISKEPETTGVTAKAEWSESKPVQDSRKSDLPLKTPQKNLTAPASTAPSVASRNKGEQTADKRPSAGVKEASVGKKEAVSGKASAKSTAAKPVISESEPSSPKAAEASKEEPKPAAATGEGVRPRRVSP